METKSAYTIAFRSLPDGKHQFEFKVGKDLFDSVEGALVADGNLTAKVEMTKSAQMLKFHFDISGTVRAVCDICLDEFDYPIEDCEGNIVVKFGDEYEEVTDELYVIPESDNEISVAQWIYELICVMLPIRFEHSQAVGGNGQCNPEMLERLGRYLVEEKKTDESDAAPEAKETDPRWDALKGLMS